MTLVPGMARPRPTPDQELEFTRLRAFVVVGFESLSFPVESQVGRTADAFWAKSPSMALRGLRQAVSDVVEMTQDLEGLALDDLEARLREAGAPSLRSMRDRRLRQVFQILNRGQVRNQDEWYVLTAVLSNTDDLLLDAPGRERAGGGGRRLRTEA